MEAQNLNGRRQEEKKRFSEKSSLSSMDDEYL